MPKFPRLVVPGYPHHVTQRGTRRQRTFFEDADYKAYLALIRELKVKTGVEILAYCLMPNHVHFVVVPLEKQSLARLFGTAHHRYAKCVNAKHEWRGHLWQERFYSVVMDESHTLSAMRYIEQNPTRADLCRKPDEWPWSSVHANLGIKADGIVDPSPIRDLVSDWSEFLAKAENTSLIKSLRSQTNTGRPVGDERFIELLERKTSRRIRRYSPGPAPKR